MLTVRELHQYARSLPLVEFKKQLGPFALVQRPTDDLTRLKALQLGTKRTVALKPHEAQDDVSLLFEFDHLVVATLPPLVGGEVLSVGRSPDNDLVVEDPSVSKHHASLTWDGAGRCVHVQDLASSNGTQINGERLSGRLAAKDGDTLSFGDARFCLLLTETLFAKLTTGRFRST